MFDPSPESIIISSNKRSRQENNLFMQEKQMKINCTPDIEKTILDQKIDNKSKISLIDKYYLDLDSSAVRIKRRTQKLFYPSGNLKYSGEVFKNMMSGFGKFYFENNGKLKMAGTFLNNLPHGQKIALFSKNSTL